VQLTTTKTVLPTIVDDVRLANAKAKVYPKENPGGKQQGLRKKCLATNVVSKQDIPVRF
jgi:hypothetical protein